MRPAPVGAEDETRTRDLFITSELLCQLSYSGKLRATKVSTARRFKPRAMLPHGVSAVLDVVSCRAGPRHPRGIGRRLSPGHYGRTSRFRPVCRLPFVWAELRRLSGNGFFPVRSGDRD